MPTTPERADDLAKMTRDAYSYPTYGARAWRECASFLLTRGYCFEHAEDILRSKITRWAYDASYPKVGRDSLRRYMDRNGSAVAALLRTCDNARAKK